MDHFTSRDDTRRRARSRRGFLGGLAAGVLALGAAALPSSFALPAAEAGASPHSHLSQETPTMTGAEYVALLGGAVKPEQSLDTGNWYDDVHARWAEIAGGPLAEAIDMGALAVCPKCLFVNLRFAVCHICLHWQTITREDVQRYLADLRENGGSLVGEEEYLINLRIERAVDFFGEPELAYWSGQALYVLDVLRAEAAA